MSQDPAPRRIPSGRIVADFTVVLLGVFVALWAHSWMNAREDRSVEEARLEALRANVDSKLAEIRAYREHRESAGPASPTAAGSGRRSPGNCS